MKALKDLKKKILGEKLWRNPFNNGKYANMKCFCGSSLKLKRCHGLKRHLDKGEMDTSKKLFEEWEASREGFEFFQKVRGEK